MHEVEIRSAVFFNGECEPCLGKEVGNTPSGVDHLISTRSIYNIWLWGLGDRDFNSLRKCYVTKVTIELRTAIPAYNIMLTLLFVSTSLPQVSWEKLEVPRLRLGYDDSVSSRWCETTPEPENGYSLGTRGPGSLGRRGDSNGEIGR